MMRPTSPAWPVLMRYTHSILTQIDAYLAGSLTYTALPITAGQIAYDDTGTVKRRLTLRVPAAMPDGTRLDPGNNPAAPLAAYGQRLRVKTGITYPDGGFELLDHGWYLITSWQRDGDEIAVEAADLAQLLVDDKMEHASSPPAGATFGSEFARLMHGNIPTTVDSGLVERAIGGSVVWDIEREKSLADLCTSWPARWYVDDAGTAHAAVPYPAVGPGSAYVVAYTDGQDGTIIKRARGMQRGALFNVVVVDGKAPDNNAAAPHSVATITDARSPIRVTGPYGRVVRIYQHDSILTQAQADATAAAQLVTFSTVGRAETADVVPDPALQLGDIAALYTRDGDQHVGRVTAITLPLVASGAMSVTVSTVPLDDPNTLGGPVQLTVGPTDPTDPDEVSDADTGASG